MLARPGGTADQDLGVDSSLHGVLRLNTEGPGINTPQAEQQELVKAQPKDNKPKAETNPFTPVEIHEKHKSG